MQNIENTLRDLLRRNIVAFTYRKVNGEIRHAIGTRNLTLASAYTNTRIPTPTGDMQPNSYYDVQSNGWRSWKTGYVISIDNADMRIERVIPVERPIPTPTAETLKKGELPKREIPISKPTTGGTDIDNLAANLGLDGLGDFFGGLFGGGIPKEEIRKSMDDLDKDIDIAPFGKGGAKVGKPYPTDKGLVLDTDINVDDFAKIVAHYVVEELISRFKQL